MIIRPAAEVLVLLDVVRLEPDAEEVVPQLALVALHPVHLPHTNKLNLSSFLWTDSTVKVSKWQIFLFPLPQSRDMARQKRSGSK